MYFSISSGFKILRGWSHLMTPSSMFLPPDWTTSGRALLTSSGHLSQVGCVYGFVGVILWKFMPWLGNPAYGIGLPGRVCPPRVSLMESGGAIKIKTHKKGRDAKQSVSFPLCVALLATGHVATPWWPHPPWSVGGSGTPPRPCWWLSSHRRWALQMPCRCWHPPPAVSSFCLFVLFLLNEFVKLIM